MYYVIKCNDDYLGKPKNDSYDQEVDHWIKDIDEALLGEFKEMERLSRRITRPGVLQVVKVRVFEM